MRKNDNELLINIHKLPHNGLSDIIEDESSSIKLYNNIYIASKKKINILIILYMIMVIFIIL